MASAQGGDPFCRVEVVAGAPVWFSFYNASDFTSEKSIQYVTVLRISYAKKPDKIVFYTKASDRFFDGSSANSLSSDNFQVQIEDFVYMGPSSGQIIGKSLAGYQKMSETETYMGRAWIVTSNVKEDNPVFNVYLRFKSSPLTPISFSSIIADAYTNICNFYVQTWYTDATDKWPY